MRRNKTAATIRHIAWRVAAAAVLVGLSMRAPWAQQPAADANRSARVQPPVLSHSTIGGASFTRPGPALLPLGGPAKPGATSSNGTSIRPKH